MFAYCLNNPVAHSDGDGMDARVCISADGTMDDSPWRDISPSGGGIIYHCDNITTKYDGDKFYTQIIAREVWKGIKKGAKWAWDTYSQELSRQQNAQMLEARLMLDGIMKAYDYLEKTEIISIGKNGYHSVMATNEGNKAMAYFFAPVPSPIDEYFAAWHGLKALYHLYLAGMEVVQ